MTTKHAGSQAPHEREPVCSGVFGSSFSNIHRSPRLARNKIKLSKDSCRPPIHTGATRHLGVARWPGRSTEAGLTVRAQHLVASGYVSKMEGLATTKQTPSNFVSIFPWCKPVLLLAGLRGRGWSHLMN
jgi:hypothetical protein